MRTTIILLFILTISIEAFGQGSAVLPVENLILFKSKTATIKKIRKLTKVFVFAGIGPTVSESKRESMAAILKENKSLSFINQISEAEFTLEYTESPSGARMRAFYINKNGMFDAWIKESAEKNVEAELTREFLKAFEEAKAKK